MYGASGTDDALNEDAPLRPLTPYAESKVHAEEGLFALAGPDFVPVSMRNATVFGVSPRLTARHRAEQPRRMGAHDGADQAAQ